jgi:hypothetical protein
LASAGLGLMISASVDDLKTATVLSTIVILCMLARVRIISQPGPSDICSQAFDSGVLHSR